MNVESSCFPFFPVLRICSKSFTTIESGVRTVGDPTRPVPFLTTKSLSSNFFSFFLSGLHFQLLKSFDSFAGKESEGWRIRVTSKRAWSGGRQSMGLWEASCLQCLPCGAWPPLCTAFHVDLLKCSNMCSFWNAAINVQKNGMMHQTEILQSIVLFFQFRISVIIRSDVEPWEYNRITHNIYENEFW